MLSNKMSSNTAKMVVKVVSSIHFFCIIQPEIPSRTLFSSKFITYPKWSFEARQDFPCMYLQKHLTSWWELLLGRKFIHNKILPSYYIFSTFIKWAIFVLLLSSSYLHSCKLTLLFFYFSSPAKASSCNIDKTVQWNIRSPGRFTCKPSQEAGNRR